MESRFQSHLGQLKLTILEMAALTERALEKAIRALVERNSDQIDEIIEGDNEINLLEVDADRHSLRLLALDQPMAGDLRFIIGCMRIAEDLERIADQAVNLAQRAQFLNARPPLPVNHAIAELADTAMDMLRAVISSFVNGNAEQAMDVCRMDDVADELNYRILKDMLACMMTETPAVERSVQTIIASRNLERVADQATNIAESVIFMVRGVNVKHHCQKQVKLGAP